jgi:hypothetical protein
MRYRGSKRAKDGQGRVHAKNNCSMMSISRIKRDTRIAMIAMIAMFIKMLRTVFLNHSSRKY